MIGVLILSLTCASCLATLRVVFNQLELVRNTTLASQVLQTEIENLRLMSWEQILEIRDGSLPMDEDFAGTAAEHFQRRIFVQDTRVGLRRVSVEVEWAGFNGTKSTRRYSTYFARNGLSDYDYRAFR